MSNERTKLTVLVSHPIQYFVPVYRALARVADLDFSVLYRTRVGLDGYLDSGFGRTVQWDIPLLGGYPSTFLSAKTMVRGLEWSVVAHLLKHRPDVLVLHGYNHATNLLALVVAKLLGARVLMRGDTRVSAQHKASGWKARFKRLLFRLVDGCISIGTQNHLYYSTLGVPDHRTFFAPMCVDNRAFFLGGARSSVRCEQRALLNIPPDARVVLFASKLTERKRAGDLLQAFASLGGTFNDAVLLVVGSGAEEAALRSSAEALGSRVRFLGFRNQSELPQLYAASDVFVLPSVGEPWGLVVNEAMAAGLPVIVSDDVGAAPDLVEGKDTGLVFPVGDIDRLTRALEYLLDSSEARERMGRNASMLIDRWSVSASADGIAHAARAVLRNQAVR
jgi:glycosyltransferase involved in cell wall biosynthesis